MNVGDTLAIIVIYILEVGGSNHDDGSVFVGEYFLGYLKAKNGIARSAP
jgi:hypothetical protein